VAESPRRFICDRRIARAMPVRRVGDLIRGTSGEPAWRHRLFRGVAWPMSCFVVGAGLGLIPHRDHGQCDSSVGPFRGLIVSNCEGSSRESRRAVGRCHCSSTESSYGLGRGFRAATGEGTTAPVGPRRPASPVRLTLASRLGNNMDGAWWPRTGLISRELTELVSALDVRLGQVIDINVNWSSLQRQADLNWGWWQGIRPHIMTVGGRDCSAPNWGGACGNGSTPGGRAYPCMRPTAIPAPSGPPNASSAWPGASARLKCVAHGELMPRR
jgi:Family of unknown function (DUF5994)